MVGHNTVYAQDGILFSHKMEGRVDLCPNKGDPENPTLIIRETRQKDHLSMTLLT